MIRPLEGRCRDLVATGESKEQQEKALIEIFVVGYFAVDEDAGAAAVGFDPELRRPAKW